MEILTKSFGSLIVYLFRASFWGVLLMFMSGVLLAWFGAGFMRGVEVVVAGKVEKHRGGWLRLMGALALLLVCWFVHGAGFVATYWPVLLVGVVFGFFLFYLHWWAVGGAGILLSFCVFLFALLLWTFHAFTGKTAIMEVKVRSVEQNDERTRISLIVKDLKKDTENTYYIIGEKWGISADVVLFDDWVVWLGGKTFYRLNSIVGATDDTLDRRVIDDYSQPMWLQIADTWEALEQNEDSFLGIRAVYENIILKSPVVGREYTIYVDNDGALVPEVKE